MYCSTTDPGIHAACEWLLRTWKQEAWLIQVNDEWAKGKVATGACGTAEKYQTEPPKILERTAPGWYVNGQGQTMVVIPSPVEFVMGSPPTEAGRQDHEIQHKKRIGRTFALAAKPVTVEQFRQFEKGYVPPPVSTRTAEFPVVGISWYMAAKYCNWLSKEEGISEDGVVLRDQRRRDQAEANYLSLTGYRLPTESEMEYATRAGAVTSGYYGETDELLAEVCVVQQELKRKDVAGRSSQAE